MQQPTPPSAARNTDPVVPPLRGLILPGYGNSDSNHWQTRWEVVHPGLVRVQQQDWNAPSRETWQATLETKVGEVGEDVVLVAHSVACLLVAHWANDTRLRPKGALLVAPPDPNAAAFPKAITGFSQVPASRLPFPSIVVASTNDPYASVAFAQTCAEQWGSRLVTVGAVGHINSVSGLGDWADGYALVQELHQIFCGRAK